ncbi:MAG: sulfotransferase family 2 domain-containing protein [Proteobacteria bacterium]|nr:sulfotransferase family 2 domain-containing protein [Pseudomonadota bacterium]
MPELIKTVIFHHIPKAGGSTVVDIATRQYSPMATYPVVDDKETAIKKFQALSPVEKRSYHLIWGHQAIRLADEVEALVVFTMFRQPVDRVISLYYYYKKEKRLSQHPLHALTMRYGLEEFFSQGVDKDWPEFRDGQFKSIGRALEYYVFRAFDDGEPMQTLKKLSRECFSFGLIERFDESLLLLKDQLDWRAPLYYVKRNVTKHKRTYPKWLVETIQGRNEKDMELYAFLEKEFDARITAHGPGFSEKLRCFQSRNRYLGAFFTYKERGLRFLRRRCGMV